MVARERAEARLEQMTKRVKPNFEEMSGLRTFIPEELRSADVDDAVTGFSWKLVTGLVDAQVIVMEDPSQRSPEVSVAAAYNGAWIINPSALLGAKSGVYLKIKPAWQTRRWIYITDRFRMTQPSIVATLEAKTKGKHLSSYQPLKSLPSRRTWQSSVAILHR